MVGPTPISDLPSPRTALITGGKGDFAQALRAELEAHSFIVKAPSHDQLDVTSMASISAAFENIQQLDLLVCNAGLIVDKTMTSMSEEDFARVLDVNLTGAFRTARAALKLMARQRRGHIVFLSSFSAFSGPVGQASYASAKAGLVALAQSLAREYGARNIRVNCILPGFMETGMTAHLNDDHRARLKQAHTLGRFNTPLEAARFIRFLHLEMPHTSAQVFSLDSRPHRWT